MSNTYVLFSVIILLTISLYFYLRKKKSTGDNAESVVECNDKGDDIDECKNETEELFWLIFKVMVMLTFWPITLLYLVFFKR